MQSIDFTHRRSHSTPLLGTIHPRINLSNAPEIFSFYDRTSELSTLKQWIVKDHCRLITLFGLSGIGKTALTVQLIPQIQAEFDYIIWRSLNPAPPLELLQTNILQFLSRDDRPLSLPESLPIDRSLIILDDLQNIFASGQLASHYQPGYENYGTFFKQIATSSHQSCFILLSWEKPREFASLEGKNQPCKSLQIEGLGEQAGELLREKGLLETENWSQLIDLYQGNPLWLKIVASTIQELFQGRVDTFLKYEPLYLGEELASILSQHFHRLSELEKQVITCISHEVTPLAIPQLLETTQLSLSQLFNVLQSLQRRSLIEIEEVDPEIRLSVKPVVKQYVRTHFPQ
ncbi:MAG: NB-ARC domain-containing protein [Actinomycetota bacterium]